MRVIFFSVCLLFCLSLCSLNSSAHELTPRLLEWSAQNPLIKVAVEDHFPPFDYVDKKGQTVGVGNLIRNELSLLLPVNLQVTSKGPFTEQLSKLNDNQIDVISLCAKTPERSDSMLFTKPLLFLTPIIAIRKTSVYRSIHEIPKSARIAVPFAYSGIASAEHIVGKGNVIEVKNTEIGLQMVNDGRLDGLLTFLFAKDFFVDRNVLNNIRALPVLDVPPTPLGYCVNKNKPELVEILNGGIERLGEDYFNHLLTDWITAINEIEIKPAATDPSLLMTGIVAALIIFILFFIMYRYIKEIALKFSTLKFKVIYFVVIALFFICIFTALGMYFDKYKIQLIAEQKERFNISHEVTKKRLDNWYQTRLKVIQGGINNRILKDSVAQLSAAASVGNALQFEQATHLLRALFKKYVSATLYGRSYAIISLQGEYLLNSDPAISDKKSAIKIYRPDLFARAVAGQSVFIPSIWADFDGKRSVLDKDPVVYIVVPITDLSSNVIALLAVRFDAPTEYSQLLNDRRVGRTFESYAIDKHGYLLSESRFIDSLHKKKMIPFTKSSILRMRLPESGHNPIVEDALLKRSNHNFSGYRDYMGNIVVGQWLWLDKYNFMLVSEVNFDEMYEYYTQLRQILLLLMVCFAVIVTAVSWFMIIISDRANALNRLSKDKFAELVTQRTRELASSEQKNSLIVNSVADGILGLDNQGRIAFFNQAAEKILGYQELDVLSLDYNGILYAATSTQSNVDNLSAHILTCIKAGNNRHINKDFFVHKNGYEIPVSYSISVVNDLHSHFNVVIIFQDISRQLADLERARGLLEFIPVAVFVLNMEQRVIEVNAATEQLLGYERPEILNSKLAKFVPEERLAEHLQIMDNYFSCPHYEQMGLDRDLTIKKLSGEVIFIEAIFSTMELNGELMVIVSALDITKARQAEKLLLQAKELADEASRSKSNFLANMSHEIRTPMNAIIGMSQLALHGPLQNKERNYIRKTHQAALDLLTIINDILDFSKIEAHKLQLDKSSFSLVELLENVTTILEFKIQDKGLSLQSSIAQDVPIKLIGDALRLKQVLINLVGNAVKFTSQGEIRIKVCVLQRNSENIKLRITVQDTGIGMSEAQQGKLFNAFSQADPSITRKYGGTGLGLSISKRLVNLMEGDIGVVSQEGLGSEFFFSVLLEEDKQCPVESIAQISSVNEAKNSQQFSGVEILLVEDNVLNKELATLLLQAKGVHVSHAEDGTLAIEKARENHYDAILMDIQMPNMDGYSATVAIREFDKSTPIIAMTANAMTGDLQKQLDVNMNDYIIKPIDVSVMFNVLKKWVYKKYAHEKNLDIIVGNDDKSLTIKSLPVSSAINKKSGLAVCDGDLNLYFKILRLFKQSNLDFNERITEAWKAKRWLDAQQFVHTLKATAGNIGAQHLYKTCHAFELECAKVIKAENIPTSLVELNIQLTLVLGEIDCFLSLQENNDGLQPDPDGLLSFAEIQALLQELRGYVDNFDTQALDLAFALQKNIFVKEDKIRVDCFIEQLEHFDFDSAQKTLVKLTRTLLGK